MPCHEVLCCVGYGVVPAVPLFFLPLLSPVGVMPSPLVVLPLVALLWLLLLCGVMRAVLCCAGLFFCHLSHLSRRPADVLCGERGGDRGSSAAGLPLIFLAFAVAVPLRRARREVSERKREREREEKAVGRLWCAFTG